MTRYPKSGKNGKWTINELKAISSQWKGDTLSDGGGLSGEVRVSGDSSVSIRFKYAFRWEGKIAWFSCGTYPANDLTTIRDERDKARNLVKAGTDPRAHKKAARLEAQADIEETIRANERKCTEALTVNDLYKAWI